MDKDILDVKGRIFDIQKYSIHDGPGIRTIVFLKGCYFTCKWCCNPESQSYEFQTMNDNGKNKLIGRDVTVGEVMEEVLKDRPYYKRSGGGLTLSGGETLFQPEFSTALLQAAKESGINTAIESTAFAKFDTIEKYFPYLDLFLMDIKHMNSQKHKDFVGQPNTLVLENAMKIAKAGQKLIIRVPVIPGFNHTPEEILEIAKFTKTLPGVEQLHLLPYHRLGQDKYEKLGRKYDLANITPMSDDYMIGLMETAKTTGLEVQIGG
jgi:pyruvate formate lyase activating enzyme